MLTKIDDFDAASKEHRHFIAVIRSDSAVFKGSILV